MYERVLIVDDDDALRESLAMILSAEGYELVSAARGEEALERIDETPVDVVLCDLRMPGIDGFELIPQLCRRLPGVPVILMSAHGTTDLAIEAIERGAYDYLAKPFQPSELLLLLRKTQEREKLRRANQLLQRDVERAVGDRPIVAASEPMIELLELLERTAAYKTTTLLTGESGTGKEVLARAIHAQSPRRNEPFVAVNCGAIGENLLESELFGHMKGSFTGAFQNKEGLFEAADHGTLFLDEIGELPLSLQVKLLRVIQEKTIRRVGGNSDRAIDVRLVSATNRKLEEEVAAGRFREDLYYRLNVIQISLPSLRERVDDIPLLVKHFIDKFSAELGKPIDGMDDEALAALADYAFPGNVRELENIVERAVALARDRVIPFDSLPPTVTDSRGRGDAPRIPPEGVKLESLVDEYERKLLGEALRESGGVKKRAARLLGISFRSFRYRLEKLGLEEPDEPGS